MVSASVLGCVLFSVVALLPGKFVSTHGSDTSSWQKRHVVHKSSSSAILSKLCSYARSRSSSTTGRWYRFLGNSCQSADYLPDVKHTKVKDYRGFSRWSQQFLFQQRKWCGVPSKPISFSDKNGLFENAAVNSWPWMVSLYQMPSYLTHLLNMHWNGEEILKRLFPFAAANHQCGGVLISSKFILTAAHCVVFKSLRPNVSEAKDIVMQIEEDVFDDCMRDPGEPGMDLNERARYCFSIQEELAEMSQQSLLHGVPSNSPKFWQIYIGTHLAPSNVTDKYSKGLEIKKVKSINFYKDSGNVDALVKKAFHEDIALLELETPIKSFTDSVRPICLTDYYSKGYLSKDKNNCAVAGWGVSYDEKGVNRGVSDQLMNAPYTILSDKDCKKKTKYYHTIKDSDRKYIDSKKVFCAAEKNYKDSKVSGQKSKICYGDSGGPLICKHKDGRWYNIGIVSTGKSSFDDTCENSNSPDIFTEVPYFMDWILTTMYNLSSVKKPTDSLLG